MPWFLFLLFRRAGYAPGWFSARVLVIKERLLAVESLVVPIILALLVYLLNKSQKDTELKIAEMRRIEERESADQRAKVDKEIEKDRQRQKALEDYLDRMTELLLENKLRKSLPSDEIRSIARTRTLTILRDLDGIRKSQLIQFLYESSLIGKIIENKFIEPILDLSFADLRGLDLEHGNLSGISLPKANLRNSNFYFANLIGANFYNADLDDSNFSWAQLTGSNLRAGLKRVNFVSTNLDNANLVNADLIGAKIWYTTFKGANLQHANFMFKDKYSLKDATNLEPATLMGVDFTGADLTESLISSKQLLGARSLSEAILPNGQVFEKWEEDHNLKDDKNFEADILFNFENVFDFLEEEEEEEDS